MDAVSYSHSAKQAQRIEKFIENPDSTSGIVTVPKVIEAGESVTVPAGRVAVLPNVQVDGTLNVEGDVFIPSGATLSSVVEKVTSTDNAITRFDGTTGLVQNSVVTISDTGNINLPTGARITGDFSNATISNRVAFQTSTINGNTIVTAKPNGAGTSGVIRVENNSDSTNASYGGLQCSPSAVIVGSGINGVGTYLPMAFLTGGAERMRIDTAGNVGIGTTPNSKFHIAGTNQYEGIRIATSYSLNEAVTFIDTTNSSNIVDSHIFFKHETDGSSIITFGTTPAGSKSSDRRVERLAIDGNGNVLLNSGTGGLGYGTGSGGTVTQLTSKTTQVVLNKPSGKIITANTSIPSSSWATFQFTNSSISSTDMVIVNLSSGGTLEYYDIKAGVIMSGGCYIQIRNMYTASLADTLVLEFAVIKGAVA